MADNEKTFDLKDEQGKPLAEGKPSPITVEGLTPNTTYKGWKLYYVGKEEGADVPEFKTLDVVPAKPTLSVKAGDAKIDATLTDGANEGSDVTKRQLVLSAGGKALTTLDAKSGTAKTFTDLTNDKLYSVHAEVTNGAGVVKSDEVEATPEAPVVKMTSFKIDNLEPTGEVGESATLTLSDITPADTTDKGIDVSVDDNTVATVTDNKDNTYTVNFVKEGTTEIHWVAKDGGGAKADGTVTVSASSSD